MASVMHAELESISSQNTEDIKSEIYCKRPSVFADSLSWKTVMRQNVKRS